MAPFPHPALRTGHALLTHPAPGQALMLSPTVGRACEAPVEPAPIARRGIGRGSANAPCSHLCASCTTTGAAGRSRFRQFPRPAVHPILQMETKTRVLPSLQHVTRSATSEHFVEFLGFPISSSSSLPASVLNQGSFPPLALPNIVGRTSPSATPWCPAQFLAERQLAVRTATPQGFPCCHCLPLSCMPSSLPRRNRWVHVSLTSPSMTAFPVFAPGRLPHYPFRGLLNVHSHYGLHDRQVP